MYASRKKCLVCTHIHPCLFVYTHRIVLYILGCIFFVDYVSLKLFCICINRSTSNVIMHIFTLYVTTKVYLTFYCYLLVTGFCRNAVCRWHGLLPVVYPEAKLPGVTVWRVSLCVFCPERFMKLPPRETMSIYTNTSNVKDKLFSTLSLPPLRFIKRCPNIGSLIDKKYLSTSFGLLFKNWSPFKHSFICLLAIKNVNIILNP